MMFTEYLKQYITISRQERIEEVLSKRTRFLSVVLEDIYQPHNASAVVRNCDCFGVQDLHIIENSNRFEVNEQVTQGSSKWVDIYNYSEQEQNTEACLVNLKQQGYQIVATSPKINPSSENIAMFQFTSKVALVFGTEYTGISQEVCELADRFVYLPMLGFTESFNLSVSVALCLQVLIHKLHASELHWQLFEHEKEALRLDWYKKSVRNAEILEKNYEHHYSK